MFWCFLLAYFGAHINKRHNFSPLFSLFMYYKSLTFQHCSMPAGPVQERSKSASNASSSSIYLTNGFSLACYFWGGHWWEANSFPGKRKLQSVKKEKKISYLYSCIFSKCVHNVQKVHISKSCFSTTNVHDLYITAALCKMASLRNCHCFHYWLCFARI